MLRKFVAFFIMAALGGCTGAEWNSINRSFDPSSGDSRLIDAKQRAIIAVNKPIVPSDYDTVGPHLVKSGRAVTVPVVCAEPSPDALQATAAALASSGSLNRGDVQATLAFALSNSESTHSIGLRTQTIQLLRDSYYRLCEAYMNDGIDAISYDILQRRFQNQIIALLAVEQLTGVVTGAQAGVSAAGSATGSALAQVRQQLAVQQKERDDALEAKTIAESSLDDNRVKIETLKKEVASSEGDTKKIKENELSEEEKKTSNLERNAMNATLRHQQAVELFKILTEALIAGVTPGSTTANAKMQSQDNSKQNQPTTDENVIHAVRAITLNAMNQGYEGQVCFETLRARNHTIALKNQLPKGYSGTFSTYCRLLLGAKAARHEAVAESQPERMKMINKLLENAAAGKIDAAQARDLLLALDVVIPNNDVQPFLPREIKFSDNTGSIRQKVAQNSKTLKDNDQKNDGGGGSYIVHGVPFPLNADELNQMLSNPSTEKPKELVTTLESVTRLKADRALRPACGPLEIFSSNGDRCVSICGEGIEFDWDKKACPQPDAPNGAQ